MLCEWICRFCKDNLFISNLLVLETKLLILCFIFVLLHTNRNTMDIRPNKMLLDKQADK